MELQLIRMHSRALMRYCAFILSFLFALISFVPDIMAQGRPCIINFPKDKYGAGSKNWSVGQDEKGVVYFGNDTGLLEFDGVSWTLNQTRDGQTVRAVAVLSHSTVFTGGYEEFGRWDRGISGNLRYTSLSSDIDRSLFRNDDFRTIWASDESVCFQSFNSVYLYDYKTVERVPFNHSILFLAKVRNEYWAQEMRGSIYRLKGKEFEKIPGSEIFADTDVRVILPYAADGFLIGTESRGIYLYNDGVFVPWTRELNETMAATDLNCGLLTSRNTYVFGTIVSGIFETDTDGKILNHSSSGNTLQNNTVLSVLEDNAGNIWAGLDRGISYIRYLPKMSCYIDPAGNMGSVYDAVLKGDKLFLATNQGVFYLDAKDLTASDPLANLKLLEGTQGQAWSFYTTEDRLFCCHNRGIREIGKGLEVSDPYVFSTGVYGVTVANIKEQEALLVSSYTSLKIKRKDCEMYNLSSIPEPILDAETDHLENVWLEHFNKGVYRCRLTDDLRAVESYRYFGGGSGDGLPFKLKLFRGGTKVALLGDGKFFLYNSISDSVVPNERLNECFAQMSDIRRVVHIRGNLYWAMTGSEVCKFSYDGYNAALMESYDISAYNLSLVNAYENISILNDSLSLICLDNGFLLYDNKANGANLPEITNAPFVKSFEMKGKDGKPRYADPLRKNLIPHRFNTIAIRFFFENTLPENYYFRYYLEGVDNDWSAGEKINLASYARLPQGEYTFHVQATDNRGRYSDTASIAFEVLPPWHQTTWAYVGYAVFAILLLAAVWHIILSRCRNLHLRKIRNREAIRLRRSNEELKRVVKERDAELLLQTFSFIRRNELLLKIREEIEVFYKKQNNRNPAPLFAKVNNLLNDSMNLEEDWKAFLIKFEQKHADMFRKLKEEFPLLTAHDLKLCACLKLNLDSKDISSLMNISVRAVENNRSRLRKKLNIPSSQHLNEFFVKY